MGSSKVYYVELLSASAGLCAVLAALLLILTILGCVSIFCNGDDEDQNVSDEVVNKKTYQNTNSLGGEYMKYLLRLFAFHVYIYV